MDFIDILRYGVRPFIWADADGSFDPVVARNSEVLGSNPGQVGYLSSRLCICIQCSKLSKGLEYALLSMVLCTIKNPGTHSIRVEQNKVPTSGFLLSR